MATNENLIPIPGRLHSVATEGHVAGADEIYDDSRNTLQSTLNSAILEEKAYVAESGNGMGRVLLKKTDNFKQVVEAQTAGNTIFVIQYDFTLTGDVNVPANCVLEFEGGSVSGAYTLIGNDTIIKGAKSIFKGDLQFSGTWNITHISDDMFDNSSYTGDDLIVDAINKLQSSSIFNFIEINKSYHLDMLPDTTYGYDKVAFILKSNTRFVLNNTIYVNTNSFTNYYVVYIVNAKNVEVSGGRLIGDVETHTGTAGEYGYGVDVKCSSDVYIHDITCEKFWGDGIVVDGHKEDNIGDFTTNSSNVIIDNVHCDYNRRQGLSIGHAANVVVKNSKFTNTGAIKHTNPTRGIDIEPTQAGTWRQCCKRILIDNCFFENNLNGDILCSCEEPDSIGDVIVRNCKNLKVLNSFSNILFDSCSFTQFAIDLLGYKDLHNFVLNDCEVSVEVRLENPNKTITGKIINTVFKPDRNATWFTKPSNATIDNVEIINSYFYANDKTIKMFRDGIKTYTKFINCYIDLQTNRLESNAEYERCTIKTPYIFLNFDNPTKHSFKDCIIDTSSTEYIFFVDDGRSGVSCELIDNTFTNKAARIVKRDTTWGNIDGGKVSGHITNVQSAGLDDLLSMGTFVNNMVIDVEYPLKSGTSNARPYPGYVGQSFFDTTLSKMIYVKSIRWGNATWCDQNGEDADTPHYGTFAQKPAHPIQVGFQFFNMDTKKMITWAWEKINPSLPATEDNRVYKWYNPDGTEATE